MVISHDRGALQICKKHNFTTFSQIKFVYSPLAMDGRTQFQKKWKHVSPLDFDTKSMKKLKLIIFRNPQKCDNQGIPEITFEQFPFRKTRFYTVGVPPETQKTPTFYMTYLRAPNSSLREYPEILGGSLLFCREIMGIA